jgi:uncharacterized protein
VTRRLEIRWPDRAAFAGHPDERIRILAVSDEREPALEDARTRQNLGRIDLVVGAGDLEPDYLGFLADAFVAPLVYVRGNHDHGGAWAAGDVVAPEPLPDATPQEENGLRIAGLSWPERRGNEGQRDEKTAWLQAARLATKSLAARGAPLLVVSHAPPTGSGDVAADPFHAGFPAYDWLARRLKPPLWIHGHTPLAAGIDWADTSGPTAFVNVTGATLLELHP